MFDFSSAPATFMILIVNVMVSIYALFVDRSLIDRLSFRPREILQGREYQRLLTAGFVHVGLGHLFFNMFTLFFFGPVIEQTLGSGKFLLLYFGAELAAHGFSLYLHKNNPSYAAIGASGAVSGIVFSFCLFAPFQSLYLFFIPIPIPAVVFAVLYVLGSIYAMKAPGNQGMTGGIAHEAHIGGAVGGVLLTVLLEPGIVGHFFRQVGDPGNWTRMFS
jgi:membrane associated rhomboid family serine protease